MTLPQVSVTAVQLLYARDGDLEILISSTFGGEIADAKVAHQPGRTTGLPTASSGCWPIPPSALAEWLIERVT